MALFICAFGTMNKAEAACTNPAGDAGKQVYNSSFGIMQFCNGTNWISMAGGSTAGGGGSDDLGNHTATTALDMATNKITNLGTPTAGTDAATKAYVDSNDSDTLSSLSCSSNEVAQYNGSNWVCASVASSDTLNGLSCSSGQVAEWNGSAWVCATVSGGGGSDDLGNHTATQNLDMATFKVDNTGSVIYEALAGDEPVGMSFLSQLSCTSGQVAQFDGSTWVCSNVSGGGGGADNLGSHVATQDLNMGTFSVTNSDSVIYNGKVGDEPVLINPDTLDDLSCTAGQIAKFDGTDWNCAADIDTDTDTNTDTLADLSCSSGEVAKWNGSAWACSTDIDTDTNDNLGNHTATQALNFATFKATNAGGVIFAGVTGNAPTK
jgi:hypothetical protein